MVNPLSETITIQSAVARKPEFDFEGNRIGHKYSVTMPKTRASVRVIKAPTIVLEILEVLQMTRKEVVLEGNWQ